MKCRAAAALAFMTLLSGCGGYQAPERYISDSRITVLRPDDSVTAYVLHDHRSQRPRGILAFPDGGRSRVVSDTARYYLCAGAGRSFVALAHFPRPTHLPSDDRPVVLGMRGDTVFARLFRAGPNTSTIPQLYALVPNQEPRPLSTAPSVLDPGLSNGLPGCAQRIDSVLALLRR